MKRILFISNYRKGIGGISSQVELLQRYINEPLRSVSLEQGSLSDGYRADIFSTKGNAVKRIWLFFKLMCIAKQYDILHIHACSEWGMLPAVYGIVAGKIWHKRIIVTYHGGGAAEYFAEHAAFVRRWLERTDVVIVLNGYLEKVFKEYNIPCVVIPNVIELRQDIYRSKTEIRPKFISVRTLSEMYRVDLILQAYKHILEHYPDATLDILSDGDKRAELEQYVRDNHLSGVRFVGQVPNGRIYDYLQKNDILLSAPIVDNMPVSIMEAMNAGLLVISSRVGGVPYMIEHRKTGLLFDGLKDEGVKGLKAEIIWALKHQTESVAMIEKSHQDVQKYSWLNVRKQLLPLYN